MLKEPDITMMLFHKCNKCGHEESLPIPENLIIPWKEDAVRKAKIIHAIAYDRCNATDDIQKVPCKVCIDVAAHLVSMFDT